MIDIRYVEDCDHKGKYKILVNNIQEGIIYSSEKIVLTELIKVKRKYGIKD